MFFRSNLLNTVKSFSLDLDNQQRNWEIIFESKSMWPCVQMNGFVYTVYFDEMCQRNMDNRYSTERPVRRRPEFLSAKDLE